MLTILLIREIAKINNRDLSRAAIMGDKSVRESVKPVTVCLILGWIFCLVSAVLEMLVS